MIMKIVVSNMMFSIGLSIEISLIWWILKFLIWLIWFFFCFFSVFLVIIVFINWFWLIICIVVLFKLVVFFWIVLEICVNIWFIGIMIMVINGIIIKIIIVKWKFNNNINVKEFIIEMILLMVFENWFEINLKIVDVLLIIWLDSFFVWLWLKYGIGKFMICCYNVFCNVEMVLIFV